MSEKTTTTPSNELWRHSVHRDVDRAIPFDERKLNVLDSLGAAHATKPYMDAAVDLFSAYQENEENGSVGQYETIKASPGLESLIQFAETKAHLAVESGNVPEITGPEEIVLSAYAAEAAMERAQAKCDYLNIEPDDLRKAADEAYARSKTLEGLERVRMSDTEARLQRYATYLETGGKDDRELWQEFNASTYRAGIILDSSTGKVTPTEYIRVSDVNADARSMQGQAKMYELLSELYPKKDANTNEWKPLSDEEVAAAKAQVDKLSGDKSSEKGNIKRNSHMNEAESRPEATQHIYGNPELMEELFDESVAFADFVEKTPELEKLSPDLNRFKRDMPEIRQTINSWKESGVAVDFKSYVEQVIEAEAHDQAWEAAYSAKAALSNKIWRESEMARRMNVKVEDKREVGASEKFRLSYFA